MTEFTGSLDGSRSPAGPTSTPTDCADTGDPCSVAENLVVAKDKDSVNSDIEMEHVKLRSATEQINLLEGKLQQAVNGNAKLKVKQTEDLKLLYGLDSKLSSTKTLSGQLTETLQQRDSPTEQESQEMLQIKQEKEETDRSYKEQLYSNDTTVKEKENLVEEKASANSDIETEHAELGRAKEQISLLEGKLQQAVNENGKLKVKQTEDLKVWQGLDSKLSSTKTLCHQLTETLQQLASQTEQAEEDKKFFEEMLGRYSEDLDEFNRLFHDLSTKLEDAEQKIISAQQEMLHIKQEKEEMDRNYKERLYSNDTMIKEKDSLIKQLEGSVDENKSRLMCLESDLQCMEQELKLKDNACISLKGRIQKLLEDFTLAGNHKQGLLQNILKLESDNQKLLGQVQSITEEKSNNAESLQGEITKRDQQVNTLKDQINQLCSVLDEIRKKYELEKIEITNAGKEKADKLIKEIENKCEEKISHNKHDSERQLTWFKEEHGKMVARIQQDKELNEATLRDYHKEVQRWSQAENKLREELSLLRKEHERETKSLRMHHEKECQSMQEELELQKSKVARIQQDKELNEATLRDYRKEVQRWSQAENKLREELSLLRKEHERETKSLRMHHDKECQSMQEELELEKSKGEKQRAWLHLQWQEMRGSQQEKEVNSKKEDNMWDKRQILYLFVLTSTIGLIFILQPFLPPTYNRRIIMMIAAIWGIASIGLPCGMYGTSRFEKECSRHTGRLIYALFSAFVIYGFYLAATHTADIPALTPSPSHQQDPDKDTIWFCVIGLIVFFGNLGSSIMGWWTGGDRDP